GARVVTVSGSGGVGKTRLAAVASRAHAGYFPDGTWLADLHPVATEEAVPEVVLATVGGRRQQKESALEALTDFAGGRRMLVILDNCEHVLAAARACASAIAAGGGTVLATTRQPLGLLGEHVLRL